MKITTLTPADVDTLRAALRIAARNEEVTLRHERPHLPPGAIANSEAAIIRFRQLADGLSPSAPPEIDDTTAYARAVRDVDMLRRELDRVRYEAPSECPACGYEHPGV
jgi:hypothetical protein